MVLLCNGNEISWVRSYLGTHQFGYEPVWLRASLVTKSPDFEKTWQMPRDGFAGEQSWMTVHANLSTMHIHSCTRIISHFIQ